MKWFHILHAMVTSMLVFVLLGLSALVGFGVLDIRFPNKAQKNDIQIVQPVNAKARLIVVRGEKPNMEYPIHEGANVLGRADDQAVDIDLFIQESPARIWSSRQHAVITWENGSLFVEDLKSTNGTFVNKNRVRPPQRQLLQAGDIIQIGEVHFRVVF
jgi:hypothetical protein